MIYRLAAAIAAVAVSSVENTAWAAELMTLKFGVDTEHNINGLALAVAGRENLAAHRASHGPLSLLTMLPQRLIR